MTTTAIFWDDGRGSLAPMRDLRPIFEARIGALTTRERWTRALDLAPAALFVPTELAPMALAATGLPVNTLEKDAGPVLVVNGRAPLVPVEARELAEGGALVDADSGEVVAAKLDAADAITLLTGDRPDMEEIGLEGPRLLTRPWSWRGFRDLAIDADLRLLAGETPHLINPRDGVVLIGAEPPRVHGSARVYPGAILNTEKAGINIMEGAVVRPGAVVTGPAIIGPGSTVLEGAIIKPNTAIGPMCKAAGEIGGSVFHGFANKAHDGHLGDSWLGAWVNLGAGTTNSNLLNTYGEVTAVAEPGASRERTGETFLGCVLADHVKTAINTSIMTGAVVHTGAMWAETARPIDGAVERFAWVSPKGRRTFRFDKFEEVMRAAMSRRGEQPSDDYIARLRKLHGG